jgi:hypothetical protein
MHGDFAAGMCVGLIVGAITWYLIWTGRLIKDMPMFIRYPDGTYIQGVRKKQYVNQETHGTHHFMVTDATDKTLVGKRVAIPINSVKYFIIEGK